MIEITREQYNELLDKNEELLDKNNELKTRNDTLERVLENFISFLEDPADKPDMKQMALNLRAQMNN